MLIKSCSQRKSELDFFFNYKTWGFTKNNAVHLKIYFNCNTYYI